jgi:hypothetical protein
VAIDESRKDEFIAKIDNVTARRRIDEAARHLFDPLAFDENALLRLGLSVWISEQNANVNPLTCCFSLAISSNVDILYLREEYKLTIFGHLLGVYHYRAHSATTECTD